MYKNQLQELAQRSCFNLPSYVCTREGPDHAPRFKASVTFNGETFEGPSHCTTLRQAEHAAAEVALANLSLRGPSRYLTAKVLDETGVYKNLLQETAHRAGLKLPVYTTVRSGPGHSPVFSSTVELAGMSFAGDSAKTKKQAEKNAALAAWSALKQMPDLGSSAHHQQQHAKEGGIMCSEEQEQVVIVKVLSSLKPKEDNNRGAMIYRNLEQRKSRLVLGSRDNSLAYKNNWRSVNTTTTDASPINYSAQTRRFFLAPQRQQQQQHVGPKILPPLHLLQQCSSCKETSHLDEIKKDEVVQLEQSHVLKEKAEEITKTSTMPSSYPSEHKLVTPYKQQFGPKILPPYLLQKPVLSASQELSSTGEIAQSKEEHNELLQTMAKTVLEEKPSNASTGVHSHAYNSFKNRFDLAKHVMDQKPPQPNYPAIGLFTPATGGIDLLKDLHAIGVPRMVAIGGYHAPAMAMAPAVSVRSVIPVCAAPPMRPTMNTGAAAVRVALPEAEKKEEREDVSLSLPFSSMTKTHHI